MELRSGNVVGTGPSPGQAFHMFEQGARLVFARWTALQLAVQNECGGHDSAQRADQILHEKKNDNPCSNILVTVMQYRAAGTGRRVSNGYTMSGQ
jgi:Pre-rRNA-processing protein TSR2